MYPTKKFSDFMRDFRWRQGEHVLIAGPTGNGKTTLTSMICEKRKYVVVLASKPKDSSLHELFRHYKKVTQWNPPYSQRQVILWPRGDDMIAAQRIEFGKCLNDVMKTGGYCVVVDEIHWTSQMLKLDKQVAILHHQGRSSAVSMVCSTQRPAFIPRIVYSSASHAFIGNTTDRDDLKSLSDLGGIDSTEVRDTVQRIGRHDMLYVNPMGNATPVVINVRK